MRQFAYDLPIKELLLKYLFGSTLNITKIESSSSEYIISDKATTKLEVRFLPRQKASEIVSAIKDFLGGKNFGDLDLRVRSFIE